jgi:hypothetical protein
MRAEPINQGTGWVLWETGTDTILSILYHPMTPNFGLLDEAPVKTGSTFKSIGLSHGREQPGNWGLFVEVFDFDEGEMVSVTLPGGKALGVVTRETTEHWDDGLCEWHPLKTRRYEIKLLHVEVLGGSWKAGDAIQQNAIRWFHPAFNEQYGIRSLDLVLDTDEWNLTQGGA